MDLYTERGFEQTTVAEIARRAGLTERTFFRHFADKREVLFSGSQNLTRLVQDAVAEAPDSAPPIEMVAAGIEAAGALLQDRRDFSRRRQAIIAVNPELRERELIKLATMADAIAVTLRQRGVHEPAASLIAEAGIAVFRTAFERWVADGNTKDLRQLIRESLADLRGLVAPARS